MNWKLLHSAMLTNKGLAESELAIERLTEKALAAKGTSTWCMLICCAAFLT